MRDFSTPFKLLHLSGGPAHRDTANELTQSNLNTYI